MSFSSVASLSDIDSVDSVDSDSDSAIAWSQKHFIPIYDDPNFKLTNGYAFVKDFHNIPNLYSTPFDAYNEASENDMKLGTLCYVNDGSIVPFKTNLISTKWAVMCVEQVLNVFEKERPNDFRPRQAIEAARTWINSIEIKGVPISSDTLGDAALDAHNARVDLNISASDAAESASFAAQAAYLSAGGHGDLGDSPALASFNSYSHAVSCIDEIAPTKTDQMVLWFGKKLDDLVTQKQRRTIQQLGELPEHLSKYITEYIFGYKKSIKKKKKVIKKSKNSSRKKLKITNY